jgi:FMN phosphatase YigB (HAD superfamily)
VPLERIMFFDDTRANVEAAFAIGCRPCSFDRSTT